MARLDRLPTAKEVAQISAVIGRNFSNALLAAIANLSEPQLQQGLRELVTSDLPSRAVSGLMRYTPLSTRSSATSPMRACRATGAPRSMRPIVRGRRDRQQRRDHDRPAVSDYHCAQAGLIAKAAYYYRAAGERSAERAGLAETRNHLERGLQFARSLPEGSDRQILEAELLIALGRLLIAI